MSISLGTYGIWMRASDASPELAQEVQDLGYGSLWAGGSPPGDLAAVEELLAATDQIAVATGIINMWRDEADTVAASYHRINERYPNRFLLGVGIGHPEAVGEYQNPYRKMVDYLEDLATAGVPKEHVVLAALGPRSLKLSADKTAGSHPYFTSPRHTRLARDVVGENVLLAPEQTVIIDTDTERARGLARSFTRRYLALANYRNNMLREGWDESDLEDGGSDQFVDAIVLNGDAAAVAAGLRSQVDAGADNVNIQVLGDDPVAGWRALAAELF